MIWILCKSITFVSSFMLQHYISKYLDKYLTKLWLSAGKKWYKWIPQPLNPKVLALICNIWKSRSGPILSWRLIMKWFLRSFSSLPLIHSRRVVVSYKRKYVHELLVNRLFKPAQEKVWLAELTVLQWP